MKLWQKKDVPLNEQIEAFTVGEDYVLDLRLVPYDCRASSAHARMLARIGVLTQKEADRLTAELRRIAELAEQGKFRIRREHEDGHTAIELHLTRTLGELGQKIHTARSRNDQVLTALRLYYKDELDRGRALLEALVQAISNFVKRHGKVRMPGYTHTRKAMPSSVKLWATAFRDAMKDNLKLLHAVRDLVDQSPLGTGAGYGVPLAVDRPFTAKELGFKRVQQNPIYTQNSRGKFEATILHLLTQIMLDLNKLASDLILFTLPELGYFELPEEFCTGSSIMPQKKNPDVLELLRARYHVVLGYQTQVQSLAANLISGYNRDLQLSKEAVMRGFDVTHASLEIARLLFEGLHVNREKCEAAMTEELFATEEVYRLVEQGVPFRQAYRRVAGKY